MPGTEVNMVRKTYLRSDAYTYEITVNCVTAGSLPDICIFLFKITDESDPKDDEFLRVVAPGDFTYAATRDGALVRKEVFWRDSIAIFNFDDLETANAAWKELSARINALVQQNDVFLADFETVDDGVVLSYPMVAETVRDSLIQKYDEANNSLSNAISARDTKITSCSGHDVAIAAAQARIDAADEDLKNYLTTQAALTGLQATYVSLVALLVAGNSQLSGLNSSSDATDEQKAGLSTQLLSDRTNLTLLGTQNAAFGSLVTGSVAGAIAALQTRLATLQQEKNNLVSELNLCTQDIARLEAQVTVAEEVRDDALESVLAVCPDFEAA